MITTQNYFKVVKDIGVEHLPDTFQKSHELVKKVTQDGGSWNTYNKNETIKRMIDLYFEKLAEFQKKSAKKTSPVTEPKSEKKKSEQKIFVVKPSHGKEEKKPEPKKETAQPKQKTTTPAKSEKKVQKSNATPVERIDDEITLIKRYINLHDKKKTKDQVMNLLKAVQKAILERRVNKNSKHGKEVMQIQDSLLKAISFNVEIYYIKIEKKQLDHYTSVVKGVVTMDSIRLVKRYVGLQNKTGILDKVEKLRDAIMYWTDENFAGDKYYAYLSVASNNLNDYIQQVEVLKNKNAMLKPFDEATLNGIKNLFSFGNKLKEGAKAIFTKKNDPRNSARVKIVKRLKDGLYKISFLTVPAGSGWKIGEEDSVSSEYLSLSGKNNLGFIPSLIAASAGAMVQSITHHHLSKKKNNLSGPVQEVMSVSAAKEEKFKEIGLTGDYLKLIGRACAPTSIFIYGFILFYMQQGNNMVLLLSPNY